MTRSFNLVSMTMHIETYGMINDSTDEPHMLQVYDVFDKHKHRNFFRACHVTDKHTTKLHRLVFCVRAEGFPLGIEYRRWGQKLE